VAITNSSSDTKQQSNYVSVEMLEKFEMLWQKAEAEDDEAGD